MTRALSRKNRGFDEDERASARAEARRSGKRLGAWFDDPPGEDDEAGFADPASEADEDPVDAIARRLARSGGGRDERRRDRDDERAPRRWRDDAHDARASGRRREQEPDEERADPRPAKRRRPDDDARREAPVRPEPQRRADAAGEAHRDSRLRREKEPRGGFDDEARRDSHMRREPDRRSDFDNEARRDAPRRREPERPRDFDDDARRDSHARREPEPRSHFDDDARREARIRREEEPRIDPAAIVADAAAILDRRIAERDLATARTLDNLAGLLEDGRRDRKSAEEGLAFLAKRLGRIESRLADQPSTSDSVRPIRSALARLETRLDRLSDTDRAPQFEEALEALDRRLADISRRLDFEPHPVREPRPDREPRFDREPAPVAEAPREAPPAPPPAAHPAEPPVRRLFDEAVAEITRRQRALDAADAPTVRPSPAPVASPPPVESSPRAGDPWAGAPPAERFDAVQASLGAISQQLEAVREGAAERADQQLVAMRQVEALRRDLEDMSGKIGDLAPRASVAAIETALQDLAHRVETQRCRGVADDLLAPAERIAGELRAVIRDLDPSPIVRNLHADVLTIGRRLDALQQPGGPDAALVRELVQRTGEIREQLAALAARPLPIEKIETRLVDLTQRVDALARLGSGASAKAAAALDMGEVTRAIRGIVASETSASLDTFNGRLEALAGKLDQIAADAGGRRIDELGRRIDDLGQMLAARIDRAAPSESASSGLETLVAGLAKKIDAALERKPEAVAAPDAIARIEALLAERPADSHFHELAQRIDGVRETLSQRLGSGGGARPAAGDIEDLVRGLDRKVETALAVGAQAPDIEPIRRQLEKLSQQVDRLDDPAANPRLEALLAAAPRSPQLDDIAVRLDRMQTALAQRSDETLRVAARQNELTDLVQQLAVRIDRAAGSQGDAEALRALEQQIGALSRRLDRNDHNGGALAAVEAKIGALVAQIEDAKSATSLAAEEAVRRATQEILREASASPGALREALARELADIRDQQDESGQRTHETLLAVHETLERVVDRLATFEDELTEIRGASVDPARLAGGVRASESLAAPERARPDPDDAALDDFLLSPGAVRPQRREPAFETAAGARAEPAQMDFIAAARRAAQQAARDAAAAENARQARRAAPRAEAPGAPVEPAAAQEGKGAGLASALQDRKRPLLLGLGALVLMLGAYQIARVGIDGVDKWRHRDHHSETAPAAVEAMDAAAPADAAATPAAPAGSPSKAAKTPAAATPAPAAPARPAVAPEQKTPAANPPPPRMLVPHAETAPLDKTPVGSIAGAGLASPAATAPDAVGAIRARAEAGDPAAQYELALRTAEGRGLPRDPRAAAGWFEKAATQGLAPAQYRLGSFYEKGVGVERDFARARTLYRSAADAGNARAMHNLAVMFAEGGEGKPDYAAAAEWFRKAGEYGVRDSQFNLAILYARGLGVPQSLVQSYVWFSAAAVQGDADAGKKRDEVAARLDSRELAAAKTAAAAFQPKAPPREANDVAPPPGGWENPTPAAAPAPAPKPFAKPKVSVL